MKLKNLCAPSIRSSIEHQSLKKRGRRDAQGVPHSRPLAGSHLDSTAGRGGDFEPVRERSLLPNQTIWTIWKPCISFACAAKTCVTPWNCWPPLFPITLRTELYPLIEQLQDRLGAINDHAVAIERFRKWREESSEPRRRKRFRELIKSEKKLLAESLWDFARWWTPRRSKWIQRRFRATR